MFEIFMGYVADYLILGMVSLFVFSLAIRFIIYRLSKRDLTYFSTFSKVIERILSQSDVAAGQRLGQVKFLEYLFDELSSRLPQRSLRFKKTFRDGQTAKTEESDQGQNLKDFLSSNMSILQSFRVEINTLASPHRPNFYELTRRVLGRDPAWTRVYKIVPIDSMSRFLDILPGIFIVLGIFGTFIGITLALPQIADMDLNRLQASDSVLGQFINDIAFAMRSSIAGIFCSMLLTGLNALSPINATREVILEKIELTLENLWFFLQEKEAKDDETVIRVLKSIDKTLAEAKNAA